MSITIDWIDSHNTVILVNFSGYWCWSELYSALETCHSTIRSYQDHKITLILDFVGSTKTSATSALFAASDSIETPESIDEIVIIIDDDKLSPKLLKLLNTIYSHVTVIIAVRSHQEAFELVRSTIEMPAVNLG